MRFLLYLLWSAVSLLVIFLVAVTILLTVFHEEVEDKLLSAFERGTGRNVEVQGDFRFGFKPWPTFIANDVKLANAEWASEPWMLEVDTLQASFSLSSLLQGQVYLYNVEGIHPRVLIQQNPITGVINWYMGSGRPPKPIPWPADSVTIEHARITDAEVSIEVGEIDHNLQLDQVDGQMDFFNKLIDIQARGQLDGRPLDLNLGLDSWRNMFMREPTHIRFDGLHGATTISGKGAIADLLSWRGHDIHLGLSVPSLREVQGWVTTYLIETPELHAKARFVQPGRWPSARFEDIDIQSDAIDGRTRIQGKVRQLRGMNGIDLTGEIHYPLVSIMRWKNLESQTDTFIDARLSLSGNKSQSLAFEVHSASLLGEGVYLQGQGKVSHLLQADTAGIEFRGEVDSLAKIGLINAKTWFETDPVSGTFHLRKKAGRLTLDNIRLSSFSGRAGLTGYLDDIAAKQVGQYEFKANLVRSDTERLNELNSAGLPMFEHTGVEGTIEMQRAEFAAQDVALILQSEGLLITGKGDITDLKSLQFKEANVSLDADSITRINDQFNSNFPELGRLHVVAEAQGSINDSYNINIIDSILENSHQSLSATGPLRNLGSEMTASLAVSAEIRSASNIPPLLDSTMDVPDQLQGKGEANLVASRVDDWSFTDIHMVFSGENQGTISGQVTHFPQAATFALVADFRRVAHEALPPFEMIKTLQPENIRAFMRINKSPDQNYFSVNDIDTHLSLASGVATVNIAGEVENINQFDGLSLYLGLNTSDIASVPYLSAIPFEKGLQGTASVKLNGRPDFLGITMSSVNIAETDLHGELVLLTPHNGKPVLEGELDSRNLDLLKLLHEEERTQLFSTEALELDWINDIDVNLLVKAEHLNGVISKLDQATIQVNINNGVLSMPDINGWVGDGYMSIWLSIVALQKPYNIVVSLSAEKVKPDQINLFGDSGFIRGGEIDIDIGLGGSGLSISDFMGRAYGKVQMQLVNSSLKQKNVKLFGSDLITGVLDIIDTVSGEEGYTPIECGVIHFPVVNGEAIASQGIAIKTNNVTVLGGGVIDFGTEELELIIRPKARKGFGINAGTVVNVAKISGTIADPTIALDKAALIQSSATIGAAIVSGGWTLLAQGLLDKNKANSDVCQQTLTKPNTAFFKQIAPVIKRDIQTEK